MDVLKWVALVFVAGFIGYFGKYLARFLIGRFNKRTVKRSPLARSAEEEKEGKSDYKVEKKRLKLEVKRQKKKGES